MATAILQQLRIEKENICISFAICNFEIFKIYNYKSKLRDSSFVALLHLFAIGGGQSPKLIQHRSKTRHLTQQLVQRDWPMCVTVRRNLVSVRHSA